MHRRIDRILRSKTGNNFIFESNQTEMNHISG